MLKKDKCAKCGIPRPEHPNDKGWMMSFYRILCPECRKTDKEEHGYTKIENKIDGV